MARGDGFFKSEEGVGTKCPRSLLRRHPLFSCYYFVFFSFCRSRSVIANFSIIGALGPWCPWLSFYCQFTIIFVFLFFIVPSGCHPMFELRIFTLCKKKRMESSAVFFSCSLEMVKKKNKCGLTPNPIDGTSKDERMQVLR